MKIRIEEMPAATAGAHVLHTNPRYPAQYAGNAVFTQVITGLDENPVKIVVHDRTSGDRMLVVIEKDEPVSITKSSIGLLEPAATKVVGDTAKISISPSPKLKTQSSSAAGIKLF